MTTSLKYQYTALRSHALRGNLGFRSMTTEDTRTNIKSATTFRQDFPFTGMPDTTVTRTADAQRLEPLSESHVTYAEGSLPWTGTHFIYAASVLEKSWDLNGAYLSGTSTATTYDTYGNALTIDTLTVAEDDSLEAHQKVTTNTYDNTIDTPSTGTSRWHLGRLRTATVTASGPDTGDPRIPTSMTRTSSFEYDNTTGYLIKEVVEPGSVGDAANLTLTTTYTYDAFGHKITATTSGGGMANRTTSTTYDTRGRFPVSTTNALNQTETYTYDPCFGVVLSLTGPNQLTTTWSYDGLGRKVTELRPGSDPAVPNYTTVNYRWCNSAAPSGAVYQIETVTAGGTPSITLYDASGRAIYGFGITGTPAVVGTRTWYDSYGRAYQTSLPFVYGGGTPEPAYATQTTYDLLNRPTTILTADDPDNGTAPIYRTSSIVYNGRTTTTNPKVQVSRSVKDSQGRVVETYTNDTGSGAERGHVAFLYDPFGQLRTTTVYRDGDAGTVSTTLTYDVRGRKTRMIDPDMGTWSYQYNAAGELLSQTDAKNQTVTMAYDVLGRLVTRAEPEVENDVPYIVTTTWTYDTATHGTGKLASISATADRSKTYAETYTYDTLGRPSTITRTIDGTAYTQGQTYDAYSRPLVTVYPGPGNFKTRNTYNNLGFLTEVRDDRAYSNIAQGDIPTNYLYWHANGYSLTGALNASTLANGVTLDRVISPITGRLRAIASGRGSAIDVQNIIYNHDELGNVTTRNDTTLGRNETFTYDGLNRLTVSSVTVNGQPTTLNVSYDALGNILSKTNAGTYTYRTDGVRPHALASLLAPGSSAPCSFTYDLNGNLAWDGQRSITWTSANQVKTITKNGRKTQFWFGAGHERVVQEDSGGAKTIYIGSLQEIVKTGSLTETKNYIYSPMGRIAVHTARSDGTYQIRFLHQDALGSVTTVTNQNGVVEQRFAFDAWGKRAQTVDTRTTAGGAVTRGFTDHEHLDDFGLIHMNGRVYDPVLGRFLSADPFVQSPGDSQSYNRYSYLMNDPLGGTDPSGYFGLKDAIVVVVAIVVTVVVTVATENPGAGFSTWSAFMSTLTTAGPTAVAAGGAAGGFASGFSGTLLNGGNVGDAFRAGAIGAVWGAASALCTYGIGQYWDAARRGGMAAEDVWAGRALSHGMAQGVLAEAQGSSFRHGFYAGAFSSATSGVMESDNYWANVAKSAVVGGTASALGGGKFENGAMSGAFNYMFNKALEDKVFKEKQFDTAIADRVSSGAKDIASKDNFGRAAMYYSDDNHSAFDNDSLVDRVVTSKGGSVAMFLHGGRNGKVGIGGIAITDEQWASMRFHGVHDLYVFGCFFGSEAEMLRVANLTQATIHASPYKVGYYSDGRINTVYDDKKFTMPGHVMMMSVSPTPPTSEK